MRQRRGRCKWARAALTLPLPCPKQGFLPFKSGSARGAYDKLSFIYSALLFHVEHSHPHSNGEASATVLFRNRLSADHCATSARSSRVARAM